MVTSSNHLPPPPGTAPTAPGSSRRGRGRGRGRAPLPRPPRPSLSQSHSYPLHQAQSDDDDDSDGLDHDPDIPESDRKRKRSKVGRACLPCRRKKAKCDSDGKAPCHRCLIAAQSAPGGSDPEVARAKAIAVCRYAEMEDKAAYSRRYVETLEARLARMEQFVSILAPTLDSSAFSKAHDLGLLPTSSSPSAVPRPSLTAPPPCLGPEHSRPDTSGSTTPAPSSGENPTWVAPPAGRIHIDSGHTYTRYLGPSSSVTLVMDAASALNVAGAFDTDSPSDSSAAPGTDTSLRDIPPGGDAHKDAHPTRDGVFEHPARKEDPDAYADAIDAYLLYALSPLHVHPPDRLPNLRSAGPDELPPVAEAAVHFNSAIDAFAQAAGACGTPAADLKNLPKSLADRLWETYINFVHPLFPILDPHALRRQAESIFFVDESRTQPASSQTAEDILVNDPMLVANILAVFACASRVLGAHEPRVCPPVPKSRSRSRPTSGGSRESQPSSVGDPLDEDRGVQARETCAAGPVIDGARGMVDGTLAGLHFFVQSELLSLHTLCAGRMSLAMVHCIGLRAYYLVSSNCAARAWIIMGRAMRMAQDLGLHRDLDLSTSLSIGAISRGDALEPELRRRTWWCVYLLDRLLSVSLGRPFGVADESVDQQLPREPLIPSVGSTAAPTGKRHMLGSVEGFNEMVKISRLMGRVARNAFVRQRREREKGQARTTRQAPAQESGNEAGDEGQPLSTSTEDDEEPRSNAESDMEWGEDGADAIPPLHDVRALHRWFAAVPDQFKHAQAQVRVQERSDPTGQAAIASPFETGDSTQHYLALQSCAASVMYRQTMLLTQRSLIQSILSGSLDHLRGSGNIMSDTTSEEEETVLTECRKTSITLIRSATTIAATLAASPYLLEYGQQLLVAGGYLALTAWRRHLSTQKGESLPDTPSALESPATLLAEAALACEALRRLELALPAAAVLGRVLTSLVEKLRRKLGPASAPPSAAQRQHQHQPHSQPQLQPKAHRAPQPKPHSPSAHSRPQPQLQPQLKTSPQRHEKPEPQARLKDLPQYEPHSQAHAHAVPKADSNARRDAVQDAGRILRPPTEAAAAHLPGTGASAVAGAGRGCGERLPHAHAADNVDLIFQEGLAAQGSMPPAASHLHALAGDAGVGLQLAPYGLQTWNEMVQDSLGAVSLFPPAAPLDIHLGGMGAAGDDATLPPLPPDWADLPLGPPRLPGPGGVPPGCYRFF